MPSLAETTRAAVLERPFLLFALRAGVCNYASLARHLEVGDTEAVAAALRRFAAELPDYRIDERTVRVRMQSGVGRTDADGASGSLVAVGDATIVPDAGDSTAVLAAGEVDATGLGATLSRLAAADIPVEAAAVAGGSLLVVVSRRDGVRALRVVEDALSAVPV